VRELEEEKTREDDIRASRESSPSLADVANVVSVKRKNQDQQELNATTRVKPSTPQTRFTTPEQEESVEVNAADAKALEVQAPSSRLATATAIGIQKRPSEGGKKKKNKESKTKKELIATPDVDIILWVPDADADTEDRTSGSWRNPSVDSSDIGQRIESAFQRVYRGNKDQEELYDMMLRAPAYSLTKQACANNTLSAQRTLTPLVRSQAVT
jgi:hypothetical protein